MDTSASLLAGHKYAIGSSLPDTAVHTKTKTCLVLSASGRTLIGIILVTGHHYDRIARISPPV